MTQSSGNSLLAQLQEFQHEMLSLRFNDQHLAMQFLGQIVAVLEENQDANLRDQAFKQIVLRFAGQVFGALAKFNPALLVYVNNIDTSNCGEAFTWAVQQYGKDIPLADANSKDVGELIRFLKIPLIALPPSNQAAFIAAIIAQYAQMADTQYVETVLNFARAVMEVDRFIFRMSI